MDYLIKTSSLHGHISVPPSKSHTLRAILFAALADGVSHIHNYLPSPDTNAMIHACRLLGASIDIHDSSLQIAGVAGKPQAPKDIIDAGNSGQVLRFIGAIAGLIPAYTVITGDHSIRTSRPVQPLLDGLNGLNVFAVSTKGDQHAPIIIKGPIQPGSTTLNGEDSQPVSGLLIAAAFAPGITEIHVNNPGETPWIELTLDWLRH
jgi:3-phosphoshikimate 1-carboxyvinyltransferase